MPSSRLYLSAPKGPISTVDGTPNATATLADISPIRAFDPDDLELGTLVRIVARGEYTCGSTATNATLGIYFGGASANKPLAGVTAQAMTVSQTSIPWLMFYEGEIRAVGSAGSIKGNGFLVWPSSLTANAVLNIPSTLALRTVAIDTTTRQPVTVAGSVSQVTGAPTIVAYSLSLETLG
jgi:hypothetical protein